MISTNQERAPARSAGPALVFPALCPAPCDVSASRFLAPSGAGISALSPVPAGRRRAAKQTWALLPGADCPAAGRLSFPFAPPCARCWGSRRPRVSVRRHLTSEPPPQRAPWGEPPFQEPVENVWVSLLPLVSPTASLLKALERFPSGPLPRGRASGPQRLTWPVSLPASPS